MVWRQWHGLFERQCPHGIGHPDPDDVAYRLSIGDDYAGTHGCDGCCCPPERRDDDEGKSNRIRRPRRLAKRSAENAKAG